MAGAGVTYGTPTDHNLQNELAQSQQSHSLYHDVEKGKQIWREACRTTEAEKKLVTDIDRVKPQ